MNLDNLLRDYARQDLQRFCPDAHYWNRDHSPIADRELIQPLLREPVRFGLTPRERVAAQALADLATYEIRSRAIWDAAYPARDSNDTTLEPGTTFDQEREIWGRRKVFRSSALVYAQMLGDMQLIECYQTPLPAPATDTATLAPMVDETKEQRQDRRLKACSDAGLPMDDKSALLRLPDGVGNVADHEGVTRQAFSTDVKAALKRRENAKREGVTVHRA